MGTHGLYADTAETVELSVQPCSTLRDGELAWLRLLPWVTSANAELLAAALALTGPNLMCGSIPGTCLGHPPYVQISGFVVYAVNAPQLAAAIDFEARLLDCGWQVTCFLLCFVLEFFVFARTPLNSVSGRNVFLFFVH